MCCDMNLNILMNGLKTKVLLTPKTIYPNLALNILFMI